MKTLPILLALPLLVPAAAIHAHEDCACGSTLAAAAPAAVAVSADTPARHPLKGVVVDVLTDRSALLVKHEEIPGVMKAMTMLLKVDAATLKSPAATKNAAVTGMLVRKADGWWLEDVKTVVSE